MKQVFLTFGLYKKYQILIHFRTRLNRDYKINTSNSGRQILIFRINAVHIEFSNSNLSSKNIYAPCHLLTEKLFVDLEHQTIDYQLKGEDTMASIEKTEHVNFVILIKFVMNSTLYSNVIPLLIYGKLSYRPTVRIILTIYNLKISCRTHPLTFLMN